MKRKVIEYIVFFVLVIIAASLTSIVWYKFTDKDAPDWFCIVIGIIYYFILAPVSITITKKII